MLKLPKNSKPFIVISMLVFIQLFSLPAQSAGTCLSDKSDISEDTKKINQKLAVIYGKSPIENQGKISLMRDNVDEIYDEQEFKVDRSLPFLNQVNAVGVITDAPLGTNADYGTAILISPCHVLTNAHAITKEEARVGKGSVYVSLGQNSCNSKNEFLHQNIPGNVIAVGDFFNATKDSSRVGEDYAIIKIQNISDIMPVHVATNYIGVNEPLMMIGFPDRTTFNQKIGLRYPTANFTRKRQAGIDGTFYLKNILSRPGGSGSGLFAMGDDQNEKAKLYLTGIHQSEGGRGIQTAEIIKLLAKNNPKAYEQIVKAVDNGTCN